MQFSGLSIEPQVILDALEDPVHIIDTNGVLVFANQAWEQLIGLPRERAIGLYINDAISKGNLGFYFCIKRTRTARPPRSPILTRRSLTPLPWRR